MEWIFNGIGTALISGIIGLIIGGISGYSIGIQKTNRMKQKAGDNANQTQIGEINSNGNGYTESRR